MKTFSLVLFSVFFMVGCISTPEVSTKKAKDIQVNIEQNKSEAKKAQEEYYKLQKQRSHA